MIKYLLEYYYIKKSGLFNPVYYLMTYPDIRRADIDPLYHYVKYGWREGRNPSELFNTNHYIEVNPDVKWAGVNPLIHYIKFGLNEGRKAVDPSIDLATGFSPNSDYYPKVSIIVPNYNHEKYLRQRLNSIYQQTYQNIEVILLDDCSSDSSCNLLRDYANKYPAITKVALNETNSGSPFAQWRKGMSLASGELFWIAESDDYCDLNFLETMVPLFRDDSILLAYAHTVFVDHNGGNHPFAYENYVGQIDNSKWTSSYVETATREVNHNLGLLNTIPNVSSVLFRKIPAEFPLFSDPNWMKMKVCGDWLFYLTLIRGGRIAYCSQTNDYYRIHVESSSKKTHNQNLYYQEHEIIACAIARNYKISEDLLDRFYLMKKEFYKQNVGGSDSEFAGLIDLSKIKGEMQNRLPNVLMTVYAFSYGGGEIFPIKLANALYTQGVTVTIFDGGYEVFQKDVREMLFPTIPIIHNQSPEVSRKMIADLGIDIVHTHHASMENYFACINMDKDIAAKFVGSMHGMYELMTDFKGIVGKIYENVDCWIYAAEKNIQPFIKHGLYNPEKFIKIRNGMDFPKCSKIDLSSLGISEDSFVICLATRALEEKGWYEAIEAVIGVNENINKDVHLLLIGEGPVYDELKQNNLPGFIHLLGYKNNLDEYLSSSHLGLLPTYFPGESYPLVLIQFIFAGIPVIASDIGEIPNILKTSDGELGGAIIELKNGKINPVDLRNEIEKMVMDKEYYLKCAAVTARLVEDLRIEQTAKRYMDVYKKVVG